MEHRLKILLGGTRLKPESVPMKTSFGAGIGCTGAGYLHSRLCDRVYPA